MLRMNLDPALLKKLMEAGEPLQLCAETGQAVGVFSPQEDRRGPAFQPQVSDEELRRRATSGERRYTTGEVLSHLESL
jgi:CRISPR/Cas system-associated endonuclease Cas1